MNPLIAIGGVILGFAVVIAVALLGFAVVGFSILAIQEVRKGDSDLVGPAVLGALICGLFLGVALLVLGLGLEML